MRSTYRALPGAVHSTAVNITWDASESWNVNGMREFECLGAFFHSARCGGRLQMERPASLKSHRQRSDEDLLTALRGDAHRLEKSPAVFGGNRLRYPRSDCAAKGADVALFVTRRDVISLALYADGEWRTIDY